MKRKILLLTVLSLFSLNVFSTVWVINVAGLSYTPSTVTIQSGDTIIFVMGGSHDAREVSQITWNANSSVALPGGFQVPFGGGTLLPAQLSIGTHFYVCSNHAGAGMKGQIIVQPATGVEENSVKASIVIAPNPSHGKFQLSIVSSSAVENGTVEVLDVTGKVIYRSESLSNKFEIDLSNHAKGAYFVKFRNTETTLIKKVVLE